ncbi:hypothetical protein P0D88_31510 [Paraburkholderia sp. RL18-103-BIB-C]|uniref:hypothetical protein n=1 Tax=Paraburkholderia sp. RL18-103-BIB-C TaxID=3031637 RepID=UPI0038B71B38
MTQATSYQVPAHPSGLDMRTQLNIIVAAILGDNAGPTAPTETYPGMMWGDTTANRLKRRTNANDAWINIGPLDNFLGDIQGQINTATANKVSKTGDTMTGTLTMANTAAINLGFSGGVAFLRGDTGMPGCGFINNANNAWNLMIRDDGIITLRNNLTINAGGANIYGRINLRQSGAYGEIGLYSTDGTAMFIRGRSSGGGMEWVNNAYNGVPASMDDAGSFRTNGNVTAGGTIYAGNGAAIFGTDGNVYMPWAGDWLSNQLGAKAINGAQVQWNSGIAEFASAMGGANTSDSGNPWLMEGVRVTTSTDINRIYPRCVWCRNQ